MSKKRGRRSKSGLLGLALLLLLLLLLLPLSGFLAGILPDGGRLANEPDAAPSREPGTLRVLVVRPRDQEPVPGARITVNGINAAASDDRGETALTKLQDGPVLLEATSGGTTVRAWVDARLTDTVRLEVTASPVRTGRAPDGARALLLDRQGREIARTNIKDGRYTLPDDPDAAAVCIQCAGTAPRSLTDGDVPDVAETKITGIVAGLYGEFEVFGEMEGANGDIRLPFRMRLNADAQGRFRGKLPAGARAFGVTADGRPFALDGSAQRLPRLAEVGGRVQTALGSAVHLATLDFAPVGPDDRPIPMPPLRIEADENGVFQHARFPAVRCRVSVSGRDCATRVFEDVTPKTGLSFTLDAGYTVRGRAVDPAGAPVPHALILAEGLPAGDGHRPLLRDRADAQGRFLVRGLGGHFARVRVIARGFAPTTIARVQKNARLRVVLLPE